MTNYAKTSSSHEQFWKSPYKNQQRDSDSVKNSTQYSLGFMQSSSSPSKRLQTTEKIKTIENKLDFYSMPDLMFEDEDPQAIASA